jgi:hypothetical protein
MQKASAEGQHKVEQVQVVLDPVYKKLRSGGMSLENCERLLVFLRKGASDPAASKGEHRSCSYRGESPSLLMFCVCV